VARDRITYVGHATLLLELGGRRVLTDPVLKDRVVHLVRQTPAPERTPLQDPDLVLISHADLDHLDRIELRRLARRSPVITPPGHRLMLAPFGIRDVTGIEPGEGVRAAGFRVTGIPADHDSRRHPLARKKVAQGYLLDDESGEDTPSVYFAGDTDLFGGLRELRGRVDVALLPIAAWRSVAGPGHMDADQAARAVEMIRPKVAIPIHWGTFAAALHQSRDLGAPARQFAELVAKRTPEVRAAVLQPGESTEIP
jgi:L-ascorbate metabolism protein UlaG (beta-lactamase superfamily)